MPEAAPRDALLDRSDAPFGAPRFDRIRPEHFLPAFHEAIADARRELSAISQDPQPANFANTIESLERAGTKLARVRRVFWTLASAHATPEIRAIEAEVSQLLAAHGVAIAHDTRLFERVRTVWQTSRDDALPEARRRLLDDSYRGFVDGGAELDAAGKIRFAAIAQELAALATRFGQNVLAETADWEMLLEEAELGGLPGPTRIAAARRAAARGHPGLALFTLDRGDAEAILTFSDRRDVRERMWRRFTTRCAGGPHDNSAIVEAMLALRRERAALLGYPSYADFALRDAMAGTPDAAEGLMMRVWRPALDQVAAEQDQLERVAAAAGQAEPLAPWDWRYYAEQVRRGRYALDGGDVKRFLTLDRVRAAAFTCAERLYGLRFVHRPDIATWHADVRAWSVSEADGRDVGLLYTDYFARAEKYGGAWMGALRVQERLDEPVLPIAYLVANFAKAPPGADTGLSIDEARTLFHEFGHALHALLSDVRYPSQAGTAVARDFVEFPSKFMEHWIVARPTLEALGLPEPLIAAIGRADDFGQGFFTIEFLASAIADLELHRQHDPVASAPAIVADKLRALAMPALIAPRHGLTHFTHVFGGGYASSYYSYLWSEVLDADAFAAFAETGDLFDAQTAQRFRREILSVGNSRDPMASFVAFRGRPPSEVALLRDRRLAEDPR